MPSRRVQLAVVAVIVALAGAALYLVLQSNEPDDPEPAAQRYLDAWGEGDTDAMAALVADPPDDFAEQHQADRGQPRRRPGAVRGHRRLDRRRR